MFVIFLFYHLSEQYYLIILQWKTFEGPETIGYRLAEITVKIRSSFPENRDEMYFVGFKLFEVLQTSIIFIFRFFFFQVMVTKQRNVKIKVVWRTILNHNLLFLRVFSAHVRILREYLSV